MKTCTCSLRPFIILFLLLAASTRLLAQGTSFTYQGRLTAPGGGPAVGPVDLTFNFYTTSSGGTAILSPYTVNGVALTDGVFSQEINLGTTNITAVFNGEDVWIEITDSTHSIVFPRQHVTATPYAIRAGTVAPQGVTGDSIQNGAVTATNIASGQVVKTLNGLTDAVTIVNGTNVTLATNGTTLTIAVPTGGQGPAGPQGPQGVPGTNGLNGINGTNGLNGTNGVNASITITNTTTGVAGSQALVTNVGTVTAAILQFTIPQGIPGTNGATGPQGPQGPAGANGTNGANGATGPQGLTGPQGPQGIPGTNGLNGSSNAWSLTGSAGTSPTNGNFLGTTDNQPLELRVNGVRALRIEPGSVANIISGYTNNNVTPGLVGAVIAGGGGLNNNNENRIRDNYGVIGGGINNQAGNGPGTDYATVAGGYDNVASGGNSSIAGGYNNAASGGDSSIAGGYNNAASGDYSTVLGGTANGATGDYSLAAGRQAGANHQGTFVWADSSGTVFASTGQNQFLIRASGGVGINTNNPGTNALQVVGTLNATHFVGDGSGLTGLSGGVTSVSASAPLASSGGQNPNISLTGTVALTNLPGAVVTNNAGGVTLGGTFNGTLVGDGSGLTGLNASQLTSPGNTNTGYANFFVGPAGNASTSGAENTAIGNGALANNTTGAGNTANGNGALANNTTGSYNTANGNEALFANTSGTANTANGFTALYSNTTGSYNTANGFYALENNTTGSGNTANGFDALENNTTGGNNTALGYEALENNTNGSGNIAVGVNAGTNLTTGDNNIYIGNNTGASTESGIIRLGTPGVHTTTLLAGNVGINTNYPGTALQVAGTVTATSFSGNGSGLTGISGGAIAAGSISNASIALNAVNASQINSGQVVKSLNGFNDTVTLAAGANVSITNNSGTITIAAANGAASAWSTNGNAGANPTNGAFLGTTDNLPLELRVNNQRAFRWEPNTSTGAPNIVGGSFINFVAPGIIGATIGGGGTTNDLTGRYTNSVAANYGTVAGGEGNQILSGANDATIAGGYVNQASDRFAFIGGGNENLAGHGAVIGGGYQNNASGIGSFIGGGGFDGSTELGNTNAGNASMIGGGLGNTIQTNTAHSMIGSISLYGAGYTSGTANTIGGGAGNNIFAGALGSVIGGGAFNEILQDDDAAVIGGGNDNQIEAGDDFSVIGGGLSNAIRTNALMSTISGGGDNAINGGYATIPGGDQNVATNHAFAAGHRAKANHTGSFAWADSTEADFADTGNNQFDVRASGGVLFTSGSGGANQNVAWTPGSGSWSFTSDRDAKENFKPVDGREILDKIAKLPMTEWNYKGYGDRHVGPMAQDFHAAFPFNANDKMINSADEAGVSLAAIQCLNEKLEEQRNELEQKQTEITELKERLEKLERMMSRQPAGGK